MEAVSRIALASGLLFVSSGTKDAFQAPEIAALARRLGITIEPPGRRFTEGSGYAAAAEPPAAEDVKAFSPILESELAKYPGDFIPSLGLRRIVLCRNLRDEKVRMGGTIDSRHRVLVLDVGQGLNRAGSPDPEALARRTIHHEMGHLVDALVEGRADRDREWERLNPKGFQYGAGGESFLEDAGASMSAPVRLGFLNPYAMSGIAEDKAEVFASMMVCYPGMARRAEGDEILRGKMALIRKLCRRLSPSMDEEFWNRLPVTVSGI